VGYTVLPGKQLFAAGIMQLSGSPCLQAASVPVRMLRCAVAPVKQVYR